MAVKSKRAALTEYDGDTLTIYNAGYRELTEQERAVVTKGEQIVKEYNEKNPYGNGGFWVKKDYFAKSDCPLYPS